MNDNNYDFLAKQLMYTGFPDNMAKDLKEKMQTGDAAFVLTHQSSIKKDEVNATLFFKKSEGSDKYFFNSYHMNVKTETNPAGIGQTFYISNKKFQEGEEKHKRDFSFKEGYNLLARADSPEEQRFVYGKWMNKTGEVYNAWKGLNADETDKNGNHLLKLFHDSYGFKLEKGLEQLQIKASDKNDPTLLASLQRGNLHSVKNDAGEIMYISAFPPGRRINLFDKDMKLVNGKENKETLSQISSNGNGQQQSQQNVAVNEKTIGVVAEPVEGMGKKEKNVSRRTASGNGGDELEGSARKRGRGR